MKTFNRTSMPDSVKYNGRTYTYNSTITSAMVKSKTKPEKVIEALHTTTKKGILVKVMSSRLKGVRDLHGEFYKPSNFIFTT